jgi:hypothetical protein
MVAKSASYGTSGLRQILRVIVTDVPKEGAMNQEAA